jgi:hypothetical protein
MDTPDSDTASEYAVSIKDGILCYEFSGVLTLQNALIAVEQGMKLTTDTIVPCIVYFHDVPQGGLKFGVNGLGRIVSAHSAIQHVSCMYFVGAEGPVRKMAEIFNAMFLNGRGKFVETLAEAEAEADAFRGVHVPLLEE